MKILYSVIISFIFILTLGAQSDINKIEYLLPVSFEKIDTPGKLYFMFKDGNQTKTEKDSVIIHKIGIDSSSYNYDLTFTNASIDAVEKCKYTLEVRKDTLKSVKVYVEGVHSLNQLIYQAKEQFGEPFVNIKNKEKLYEWRKKELDILPILTVRKNQKDGELTITSK